MDLRSLSNRMTLIEELVFGAVMGVTKDAVPRVEKVSLRLGQAAWDALHADPEARGRMRMKGYEYPRQLVLDTLTAQVTVEKDTTLGRYAMALTLLV